MPRNDDGEMELVLGNRQLLSVLFILVVLLGVFFTMGYIVGRNNPSEEKVRIATARRDAASAGKLPPVTVDPSTPSAMPASSKPTPAATQAPPPSPPAPELKKEEPKKEAKKETAKKEEPKKEEPKKKEAPAPVTDSALFQATPTAGQYLQVAAIDRPGATGMAEAYRKQGFPAVITPSSSSTLFRVVIGPLKTSDAVAETKMRLKKLGVDGAILRKF